MVKLLVEFHVNYIPSGIGALGSLFEASKETYIIYRSERAPALCFTPSADVLRFYHTRKLVGSSLTLLLKSHLSRTGGQLVLLGRSSPSLQA